MLYTLLCALCYVYVVSKTTLALFAPFFVNAAAVSKQLNNEQKANTLRPGKNIPYRTTESSDLE